MVRLERQVPLPDRVVPSTNAPRPSHASTRQASWRFPISSPDSCADQSRPGAVFYPFSTQDSSAFPCRCTAGALSVLPLSGIRARGRIAWHFGLVIRWQRVDMRTADLAIGAPSPVPSEYARPPLVFSVIGIDAVGDGHVAITNSVLDIRNVSHQALTKTPNQTLWRGQETSPPVWASAQKA